MHASRALRCGHWWRTVRTYLAGRRPAEAGEQRRSPELPATEREQVWTMKQATASERARAHPHERREPRIAATYLVRVFAQPCFCLLVCKPSKNPALMPAPFSQRLTRGLQWLREKAAIAHSTERRGQLSLEQGSRAHLRGIRSLWGHPTKPPSGIPPTCPDSGRVSPARKAVPHAGRPAPRACAALVCASQLHPAGVTGTGGPDPPSRRWKPHSR